MNCAYTSCNIAGINVLKMEAVSSSETLVNTSNAYYTVHKPIKSAPKEIFSTMRTSHFITMQISRFYEVLEFCRVLVEISHYFGIFRGM
jgi:hypothetical protein